MKLFASSLLKMAFVVSVAYMVACTSQPQKQQDTALQDTSKTTETNLESQNNQNQPVYQNYTKQDLLNLKTYYFAFDQSDLSELAINSLGYHAQVIKDKVAGDSSFVLTVEGHTDERGTAEYNIALGSRRAESVARYLRVQGVPANNIRTVSYGEERPAVLGSNEEAWSKNRRAQLVY